jgi:hypothetical protein
MSLQSQRIRLALDRSRKRVGVDVLTSNTPHLLKPSNLQVELANFMDRGATLDPGIADVDQLTLQIKSGNPRTGAVLMSKTVAQADINAALTLQEWRTNAPDKYHALFEFTAPETNLAISGNEVTYYLVVSGLSVSLPVKEIAFGNGVIVIEESGISEDPPPDVGGPGYYNTDESDARYLLAADHAALYFVDGDPNGVVTATRPAQAYDAAGNWWLKTNSGTNNTGWEQRLGDAAAAATTAEFVTPGSPAFLFIAGNPNGVYEAERPAMAYDNLGNTWFKTNAGFNDTGWEQRL